MISCAENHKRRQQFVQLAILYLLTLSILFIAHLLHPLDDLAVKLLLDRDMRHRCSRRGAMPVLLARREPDYVTRSNFFNRTTLPLSPAAARSDNERLTKRMRMPRRPRTGLKGDTRTLHKCRLGRLKQRIDSHRPREPIRRPLRRGCVPALLISICSPL